MTLNLSSRVVVKVDQQPVTVTGATYYSFIESGGTQIVVTGSGNSKTITIYSPFGIGTNWGDIIGSLSAQTDLWNYLKGKVDVVVFNNYTGTTAPNSYLKLNQLTPQTVVNGSPTFGGIIFNQTAPQPRGVGKLIWSTGDTCLEYGLSANVNLQIGEELLIRVRNIGSNIANGDLVYINGASGNRPTIAKADCRYHYREPLFMATESIATNNNGWVTQTGTVNDLNTNAYSAGTTMWLYTGGTMTNVQPSHNNYARRRIGVITRQSQTIGSIYFNSVTASRLNYLTDVYSATTTNGDFPKYNSTNSTFIWDNVGNYTKSTVTSKLQQDLNTHTGDTSIHTEYSDITAYVQSQISGFTTGNTFIASGGTIIKESNNVVTIYSPAGAAINIVGSGDTTVTKSGNTYIVYSLNTGTTGNYALQQDLVTHTGDSTIHFKQSGITLNESQVTNLVTDLAGKTNTGTTAQLQLDLNSHTGDSTIHFKQSGITLNESQVTNLVTDLASKTNTGTTSQLRQDFNAHSGDTTIHFKMSGITIAESQVTNLVSDLASKTSTGVTSQLRQDLNSHTGNTNIHFTMGSIAIAESQVTNLVTDLVGKTNTGTTHQLQLDFNSHSGDTTIHFKMSGITIAESQVTNLVTDLAGKTNTGTTAQLRLDFNTFSGRTMTLYSDTKDYRGFAYNDTIDVSYNWSQRKVTITGTLDYYWDGVKKTLSSPHTFTTGHTATVGHWYLYSTNGSTFAWSQISWDFEAIQVAHVYYQPTSGATFCIRETHGLMDHHAHEDLHRNIGSYLVSGGQPFAYTASTATDNANRPSFAQAVVNDEDLSSSIAQLDKANGYTLMTISGYTKSKYYLSATRPFSGATNVNMFLNNPLTGAFAASTPNNRWLNVYQILIPTTSDVSSQKYRMVFLQPQVVYTSLLAAQAESVAGLYFGDLATSSVEYVIYTRITYATAGSSNYGKCTIAGISYNVGLRSSNVTINGGASATNHANLSNLNWIDSGHVGTNSTIPSFNASGNAEEVTFVGSGETSITKVGTVYRVYTPVDTGISSTTFATYTGTTAPNQFIPKLATIKAITGTTYTALSADNAKIIEFTSANATTITLPTGLTTGYQITIVNYGAGVKTIQGGTGATVRSKSSNLILSTIYDAASAYYRGSNVWVVFGDLTSS
jgi:hypothetical protein